MGVNMHAAVAPDLILTNGRVLTIDADNTEAEAVAVKMGRILAVGSSREISALKGAGTQVLDLRGRTVLPGLTDPHVHLADDGAASLHNIDVRDFNTNVRSIAHILEVVRAQAREVAPGTWIVGTGSPMQDFRMPEKRFPRREELDLVAPDHPVYIGFGAHVTGVTLSTEQLAFAQDRMQRLGVADKADLRLQDYRDIKDAPFDAVCSVEMIEAVGKEYWPTYFASVANLLKPGGRACIQSIVIDDALYARYINSTDFIQQYIFPGGCLPSPSVFRAQAQAAGLQVEQEHAFGFDYAETLKRWREAFLQHRDEVLTLGFDKRFMQIWEFYLCYCEAAFMEKNIDVVQYTLRKPGASA